MRAISFGLGLSLFHGYVVVVQYRWRGGWYPRLPYAILKKYFLKSFKPWTDRSGRGCDMLPPCGLVLDFLYFGGRSDAGSCVCTALFPVADWGVVGRELGLDGVSGGKMPA
jgi:hypothetical protein